MNEYVWHKFSELRLQLKNWNISHWNIVFRRVNGAIRKSSLLVFESIHFHVQLVTQTICMNVMDESVIISFPTHL